MYYLEKNEPYIRISLVGSKVYRNESKQWVKKADCLEIAPIKELYNTIPTDEQRNYRIVNNYGEIL